MRKYYLSILGFALLGYTTLHGGVDSLKKYVSIGDGFTAGFQDHALYRSAQTYSFPNLIAFQLNNAGAALGTFEQPLIADPGNADPVTGKAARYEILSPFPNLNIGPRGLTPGSALNTALVRPYDNLGIPGATLFDFMDTAKVIWSPLSKLILRDNMFGKSIFQQVQVLHPDVITFWFGTVDILGYAAGGGVYPAAPTSDSLFTLRYSQALDTLRKILPTAKIIVANIPDITAMPYFSTLGSIVGSTLTPNLYIRYQRHGNRGASFDSTRFSENNPPMLIMSANPYKDYIGRQTGKPYRDFGMPVPAGIDTTKPFGLHPQNPILDMFILDSMEQRTVTHAVSVSNQTIQAIAATNNCAVVDINSLFNKIQNNGYFIQGTTIRTDYVTGGLYSLDAFQPSIRGYGIIANEFIKTLNATYGYQISLVNIPSLPSISGFTIAAKENIFEPDFFQLEQNYPNPFNPTTTITITASINHYLTLDIFDAIGRKVTTLFSGELPPGKHEIKFDGSYLSSGMYFARLQSGNTYQIKKLVLQK